MDHQERLTKPHDGRAPTRAIVLAFGASVLASLGLTVVYLLGGHPQIEGALLFFALGGLGFGLVLWAKRLMPKGPWIEERERIASPELERALAEEEFRLGEEIIGRRRLLGRLLAAALGALGIAAIFPVRSLGPRPGRALLQTAWRPGSRMVTIDGRAVRLDELEVGSVLTVFPEGHTEAADSQTLLIRVRPEDIEHVEGREDWAPGGHIAYSKVCTHAGCPVGLYEADTNFLFCPCHQSIFHATRGARPLTGPATRPLPQLPIEIDDEGFFRARGDFPEIVGPGFWNMP